MEAPIAWRAMADRFKDGSLFLASFVIFNIYNYSFRSLLWREGSKMVQYLQ
jgi:hypothetical protein